MKISVWGCRGSLPSPGPDTIKYGGNTTCIEVRLEDGTLIIIDAGSGIRTLGDKLLKDTSLKEIKLLLTHAHWDHLMGFPFFTPAYTNKFSIHICGGLYAMKSLKDFLEHRMEPPYFPVTFNVMKAKFDFDFENHSDMNLGCSKILHINLNHPNGGYGYKIVENGKSFVFLTDNELDAEHEFGLKREEYINFCKNADILFHDAQYTKDQYKNTRGWGHSTFDSATELSMEADVKNFGIFHHDPSHTDRQMDSFVENCRTIIKGKKSGVNCFGVCEGMEIKI